MFSRLVALAVMSSAALFSLQLSPGNGALFQENFEAFPAGKPLQAAKRWQLFPGFRGKTLPSTTVVDVKGSGRALAIAHAESFRGDNFGILIPLTTPIKSGVLWTQCRIKPPADWRADLVFDARNDREVVARISGTRYTSKDEPDPVLRWHASWKHNYWRLYTKTDLRPDQWYTLTARLDLDAGTYAAWVDDQVLGEELALCSSPAVTHIYLSIAGSADAPALIDDIRITRDAPAGKSPREPLPRPKSDLLFRFAAVGDPQIGFTSLEADKQRFQQAVNQINASKAEFTLVLGDMVHARDNEDVYRDLKHMANDLKKPCHFVRGNHESKDLYLKHFHKKLDDSFTHKGWRFVMIDAEGNHAGLTKEQLAWIENEFRQADKLGDEVVICLHVSPWQNNDRGRSKYNQIGPGRDELRTLMAKYNVLLSFSGHYHRGLWHAREEQTHYLVLGGTAVARGGHTGWCVCDVYPDRIEIHQKPVFFAYERPGEDRFYNMPYTRWDTYASAQRQNTYLQQGPLIIKRHRPLAK